jgi:nitrate reductase NapE component
MNNLSIPANDVGGDPPIAAPPSTQPPAQRRHLSRRNKVVIAIVLLPIVALAVVVFGFMFANWYYSSASSTSNLEAIRHAEGYSEPGTSTAAYVIAIIFYGGLAGVIALLVLLGYIAIRLGQIVNNQSLERNQKH